MLDLRERLHDATTEVVTDLDHGRLQRAGKRRRSTSTLIKGGVGVAGLLGLPLVAVLFVADAQPPNVAIGPPETPTSPDIPEAAALQDLSERRIQSLTGDASTTQQQAIRDGTVTRDEWLAGMDDWQSCLDDRGFPDAVIRPAPAVPRWMPEVARVQSANAADVDTFQKGLQDCYQQTFRAVDQHYGHERTDWNRVQETRPRTETLDKMVATWQADTAVAVANAPTRQRAALDDGAVTDEEWMRAGQAWADCLVQAEFDVTMTRVASGRTFVADTLAISAPTASSNADKATFEATSARCREQHFSAVDALHFDQNTDLERYGRSEWTTGSSNSDVVNDTMERRYDGVIWEEVRD